MHEFKPIYTKTQENAISFEFERMKDVCYLDHAGAGLYSEKQISNVFLDLSRNIYANPHAKSTSSKLTEDAVDQIRFRILNHFNTDANEYGVIFTNGATGALKLVSESFDYNGGCFLHLQDNHTSVLGMRHNALNVKVLRHDDAFSLFNDPPIDSRGNSKDKNSLFVYPAQCNFSGTKYPLDWIDGVWQGFLSSFCDSSEWYCFLDAAGFISTNFLDLSRYKPDFVCVSFYKIFGYPTGLGALLVRKGSEDVLIKRYYGGGTVQMALSTKNVVIPRTIVHERFEDGTISFLDILSLRHGFDTFNRLDLNMNLIAEHTFSLAKYVYYHLLMLHHSNGKPAVVLYHDTVFESEDHQGGIVNFNLRRSNGQYVGYAEVLHIANLFGIQLRTGCFCNLGACQRHLKLSTDDVIKQYEKGHVCGDQNDLIDGIPTGSVRISFGYMSSKKDADEFLKTIEECFVEAPCVRKMPENFDAIRAKYREKFCSTSIVSVGQVRRNSEENENRKTDSVEDPQDDLSNTTTITGFLHRIYIYPIKSCGACKIETDWELVSTGLKYDREWMIINASGVCLTQKTTPNLCKIKPSIDLERNQLQLNYEDMETISVPLTVQDGRKLKIFPCRSKVCGDPIVGWDCGREVSDWISASLSESGARLLRQSSNETNVRKKTVKGESVRLSLTNQAQFLLANKASIEWLRTFLIEDDPIGTVEDIIHRFRPNLVVDFEQAFVENDLRELRIGDLPFKVTGKCTRCQIICIDQNTGAKSVDLLRILSREFNGKISFGVYLKRDDSNGYNRIKVEEEVVATVNVM